ncbi:MAG: RdgB/HAM1 family non-canonical purine NTP pyrophosphatase [Bacteroidales bacterium]|nr:RdgB/HAM1 family non-canonical purine NTP pyrophosphatase [Bacteroidales bacterium]
MKLIFATSNKGKMREAGEILGPSFELLTSAEVGITEDIPETGSSFRENALQKAMYIWDRFHVDCMADDSGLEVDALGGAPGIYSARYASLGLEGAEAEKVNHDFSKNIDKLLYELTIKELEAMMAGSPAPERTARFRCAVALVLDGEPHFFDGTIEGKIAYERSGNGGFGYDPVFIPDAYPDMSLAEVAEEDKNRISHRGEALRKMARFLKES